MTRIVALFYTLSRKLIYESFNDIYPTLGAIGLVTLPVTKTFRAILNISVTLQDTGAANPAVFARVLNKNASGPLIGLYSITGAASNNGVIDATIEGY